MQNESGALDYACCAQKILQGEEQLRSSSHLAIILSVWALNTLMNTTSGF
jgi:hypothetical protein